MKKIGPLSPSSSPLVLFVDDNRDVGRAVVRLIQTLGPDATWVAGVQAAIEFIANRRPDLVLLDISMPGMQGLQTLARLRRDPATAPPVVIYTAIDDPKTRRQSEELGAAEYWLKSDFDIDHFRRRLGRYVAVKPRR